MQNGMTWIMAATAACAAGVAVWVGVIGSRNVPVVPRPGTVLGNATRSSAADPLAPRLFDQAGTIRVHVAGAVKKPNVYQLPAWARVIDAVKKAGGASSNADLDGINMADTLRDGEQLRIPVRGRSSPVTAHQPTPHPPAIPPTVGGRGTGRYPFARPVAGVRSASARASGGLDARYDGPVNLNRASLQDLDRLPGVGPTTAERIVAYRTENGPFSQPEDLLNVKGIGPAKFDRMRAFVEAP